MLVIEAGPVWVLEHPVHELVRETHLRVSLLHLEIFVHVVYYHLLQLLVIELRRWGVGECLVLLLLLGPW